MKTEPHALINATLIRQTGDQEFRIANSKDIQEGRFLHSEFGLTKIEEFASRNLAALMSNPAICNQDNGDTGAMALSAVTAAKELIAALNKD